MHKKDFWKSVSFLTNELSKTVFIFFYKIALKVFIQFGTQIALMITYNLDLVPPL